MNDINIKNIEIYNEYIGKCYLTQHAFDRFKQYLCKDYKNIKNDDEYFIKEFNRLFACAKHGNIKSCYNVIRLINNNYKGSYYLFNHYYNLRFVVVCDSMKIVTCEPIRA